MAELDRRQLLKTLASAPMAAVAISWTDTEAHAASEAAQAARTAAQRTQKPYAPKFFTTHEWATVGILVDLIIPKDKKSGSATDAGVPEFMDFMCVDQPTRQSAMRGGLAWLDAECHRRHDKTFVALTEMSHGVNFFNSFRDLTASGFFTSKIGMADLEYKGNTVVPEFTGCPPEVLRKLGL
jgi:hypothetical protein